MLTDFKIIIHDYIGHNQQLLKTRDDEDSELEAQQQSVEDTSGEAEGE